MHPLGLMLAVSAVPLMSQDTVIERVYLSHPFASLGVAEDLSASVRLGDLDGDGDLDAVVGNGRHWARQNMVFFNNGRGSFLRSRLLGDEQDSTYAVPLADFDGDGDLDVAVGCDRIRSLILWNDGSGRFEWGPTFGPGNVNTRSLTVADMNQDGRPDLLMTNRGEPNAIFLNRLQGFDESIPFGSTTDSTIAVAVADVNGDVALDLVLANRDGQPNAVYLNDGTEQFSERRPYGTGRDETRAVAVADIDGDGHLDIVNANIGEPNGVYFGDGRGGFDRGIRFGADDGASYCVEVQDMNRDGRLDIVIGNVEQQNAVFFNPGAAVRSGETFREVRFGGQDATYGVAVGDLDGDGFPDIVEANSGAVNRVLLSRPPR